GGLRGQGDICGGHVKEDVERGGGVETGGAAFAGPDEGARGRRRGAPPQPLDDRPRGEAAARAHGDERELLVRALQFVQRGGDEPGARRAHRGLRAIAPPLTFTLSRSCSKTRVQLSTTEANASLISTRSMSRSVIPALPSTAWVASTGPSRWKCGPAPTCACATIRARGFSFSARAIRLDTHRIAAAPSEIREELPAVRGAGSVLAEGELPLVELLVVLVDEELPLPHELFAVPLGLPKSHRRRLGPRLLRRHVRRRDDLLRRVDQEEREDLAVPRTGGVREAERSDAVLQHVREGEAAARRGRRRA